MLHVGSEQINDYQKVKTICFKPKHVFISQSLSELDWYSSSCKLICMLSRVYLYICPRLFIFTFFCDFLI